MYTLGLSEIIGNYWPISATGGGTVTATEAKNEKEFYRFLEETLQNLVSESLWLYIFHLDWSSHIVLHCQRYLLTSSDMALKLACKNSSFPHFTSVCLCELCEIHTFIYIPWANLSVLSVLMKYKYSEMNVG